MKNQVDDLVIPTLAKYYRACFFIVGLVDCGECSKEVIHMKLIVSILVSTLLGLILFMLGLPGGIIAFGIIAGCLFYGIYLLLSLRDQLAGIANHFHIKEEEEGDKISNEEIERELESKWD